MYNDVVKLVSYTETVDQYGDVVTTPTERELFAEMKSIGQSEFYQAQAVGLKPEIKFVLSDYYDYEDEKTLIHEEKQYRIIRTYRNANELELVCVGDVHADA